MDEVKAGIRMRMKNMVFNALEIGNDLIEAKEACGHGQWLPFLRDIGFSASTAANYMRIAREVGADSKVAQLPYTKILAVLAAPPEEREELATAAEDMSAAEIRRLTEERNKAAEAANVESARADEAEKTAKQLSRLLDEKEEETQRMLQACDREAREEEREKLEKEIRHLRQLADDQNQAARRMMEERDELRARLLTAENNRVEVEVEKIPDDYEAVKARLAAAEKSAQELIDAAAEAEERAAAAEAELEEIRTENSQGGVSDYEKLHFAMKTFMLQCDVMACRPERLIRDADRIRQDVNRLQVWCDAMMQAVSGVQRVEGAVV